jgi:hypothetical protein
MSYSTATKSGLNRGRSNMSIINPNADDGSSLIIPKVLNYTNGIRTVPIMHRAFRNLEIAHANVLVSVVCEYRGVSAGSLRVLDIGYGLGYSVQRFYELGVGTLHCVEVNSEIAFDAENHSFGFNESFNYEVFNQSFQDYASGYSTGKRPAYDIVYYSPSDDFGNIQIWDLLRRVSKKGTILSVQGIPLFDTSSLGYFINADPPSVVAPDSNTYDSTFTVGMYNALNNIGYFDVYYQYLNCNETGYYSGGGGGLDPIFEIPSEGDGNCPNGRWVDYPVSLEK